MNNDDRVAQLYENDMILRNKMKNKAYMASGTYIASDSEDEHVKLR